MDPTTESSGEEKKTDKEERGTSPTPDHDPKKVKLVEINSSLICQLCKGYLIDATTITECLHSFCRGCIIKFLEDKSYCPVCEMIINKAKPNLKLDKTLQDIVYKLVPGLFLAEMLRRKRFYAERPGEARGVSPEQRGEDTERTIFNPQDKISLSLEYIGDAATSGLILKDLKSSLKTQQGDDEKTETDEESLLKRYLQCPGMCRIDVIKKFIRNKYNVNTDIFQIDVLYKRVPLPLPDHYTLIDVAYIYTWKRNEPMRFFFRIIDKGNEELPDMTKMFTLDDKSVELPPALPPPATSTPIKVVKKKKKAIKKKPLTVPKPGKKNAKNCDKDAIVPNKTNIVVVNEDIKKNDEEVIVAKREALTVEREVANEVKESVETRTEQEKCEFLKSVELTSKSASNSLTSTPEKKSPIIKTPTTSPQNSKPESSSSHLKAATNNGVKRKNPSPIKKEPKKSKLTPIQSKAKSPSSHAHAKPQDSNKTKNENDFQSLFPHCRLNIPSSLSITLRQDGETSRKPVPRPPVQNFIEILEIDEKNGKKMEETKVSPNQVKKLFDTPSDAPTKLPQSFQKIFEQSIKKPTVPTTTNTTTTTTTITNEHTVPGKRKILDIAQELYKKTKLQKTESATSTTTTASTDVTAPSRPTNQRVVKPPKRNQKYDQTLTNLHSTSLGLNYTVSVGKDTNATPSTRMLSHAPTADHQPATISAKTSPVSQELKIPTPKMKSPASKTPPAPAPKKSPSPAPKNLTAQSSFAASAPKSKSPASAPKSRSPGSAPSLTPNQLLEKYNIQNLAQLSASINFNAATMPQSYLKGQMPNWHQTMLLNQLELQNRQKWLTINPGPLLQFEKYLQSLNAASSNNTILGKIKEN